jgi:hypothetical protein
MNDGYRPCELAQLRRTQHLRQRFKEVVEARADVDLTREVFAANETGQRRQLASARAARIKRTQFHQRSID